MKIIISPAKKINDKQDFNYKVNQTKILNKAYELYDYLRKLNIDELNKVINASKTITTKTYDDIQRFNLNEGFLTAIFAYDGIQYKNINASIMSDEELEYLNNHLLILSAIYGANRPFDLIIPHRLEMQAKVNNQNLYDYWDDTIVLEFIDKDETVINLASLEYSKAITPYLNKHQVINIFFKEIDNDKLIEKGVYVKIARGVMVRYLATHNITNIEDIKKFNELGYIFYNDYSDDNNLVFTRRK